MVFLELFVSFVKIGFTSFGGLSMIPLIMDEMNRHGWMNPEDLSNLVAIAEMTPGPLGINCATFTGTRSAGFFGGIAAVLGVLAPAFTLTLAVSAFLYKFKDSSVMAGILKVIKPVCIALIVGVALSLAAENYRIDGKADFMSVAIGLLCFYLIHVRRQSVPKVLLLAGAAGAAGFGLSSFLLRL